MEERSSIVTGLLPNADTTGVRRALTEAGFSLEPLQTLGSDDLGSGLAGRGADGGIILGDTGTGVPGIGGQSAFRPVDDDDTLAERLSDFNIPETESGNFATALESGKTIVAYSASLAEADRVAAALTGAGALNVRRR